MLFHVILGGHLDIQQFHSLMDSLVCGLFNVALQQGTTVWRKLMGPIETKSRNKRIHVNLRFFLYKLASLCVCIIYMLWNIFFAIIVFWYRYYNDKKIFSIIPFFWGIQLKCHKCPIFKKVLCWGGRFFSSHGSSTVPARDLRIVNTGSSSPGWGRWK